MNVSMGDTGAIVNRRQFLGGMLGATVAASSLGTLTGLAADEPPAANFKRKIKLGVVGNGERGSWIASLFQKHGGYEMHAVADYFQEVADQCGDALGVDKKRRFSTLSGYKRLLESGVEAVALVVPPYFFPEHARAAVAAGMHVYMAKPVASDVPGCLQILAAGQEATRKQRCFLVDYQIPTDPSNNEVFQRIHHEDFGKVAQLATVAVGRYFRDPPKTANLESRLRNLIWVNDIAMGCDYIGNFDIHAIDAALWVAGKRPIAAAGNSRICRPNPQGDGHDICSVVFEYPDGLVHNHIGQELDNYTGKELSCRIQGQTGNAVIHYWDKAQIRSGDDAFSGPVENLYEAGAMRNIATFYRNVTEAYFENPTLQRSVDGALTCILGREAAARRVRLTMENLIKENKHLEVDLGGLKS